VKIRHATHPDDLATLSGQELRQRFLDKDLFAAGEVRLSYTHHDRMVLGGVIPAVGQWLALTTPAELRADYFCERRELAVVAVAGSARVRADDQEWELAKGDVLYLGRGARDVAFSSAQEDSALFLASALAHVAHPHTLVTLAEADATAAGETETANRRTIYKHLQPGGVPTAQLVLGITALEPGSVWNSMPPHVHDRRTEAYLYFDLPDAHRIQHFMGRPDDLRTLTMSNLDLVVSPSWSVHFGAGTSNYAFVWVMAGENQAFTDMDQVAITDLGCC
jgi:4-deoxy-L-threo-5-hexosulose-uronate ketol-isomerase